MSLRVGKRYKVCGQLGEGGMGTVYRAYDNELDRDVALKVIRPDMARNAAVLARFKREIQLSSKVTHPNVLRVYDLGEGEGVRFLTMQFVDGQNLAELTKTNRISMQRVPIIFRQICEGLKAAHDQGVLHRDLKPGNILIGKNDHVYLTDFGLATSDTQQTAITEVGTFVGTPHYMSPEQVTGGDVDQRSDIYALGVILYEMVTGRQPYTGNTYEVLFQRTRSEPVPATQLNPDVPRFLQRIISRCMARKRAARYADVGELLEDLKQGMKTGATDVSKRFPGHTKWLNHMTWRNAAFALALVLLLVWGALRTLRSPAPTETPALVRGQERISVLIADFDNLTGDPVFDSALEQALSIGLEGASFVESFRRERARMIAAELRPASNSLNLDASRLVAQREGIDVVITGSVRVSGSSYVVSTEAIDPHTGESLGKQTARADSQDDVLKAVGEVAVETRRALGDVALSKPEMLASLETFTSGSLDASEAYARGQKLQQRGKWQQAIVAYREAVQLDPSMGRAYAGLAVMNFNLGRQEDAEEYFLTAMSHLDRMNPRERYRTRGGYYIAIRDYEKAAEEYSALVDKVPGDSLGRANLVFAVFLARDFQRAYQQARKVVEADPRHVVKSANLAWYAMIANEFEAAASEGRRALSLDPTFKQAYVYLGLTELARGDVDQARSIWRQLRQLDPHGASLAAGGLADLACYQGKPRDAVAILEEDLAGDEPTQPALKETTRALAYLELGDPSAAVAAAERATKLSQRLGVIFEGALVHLEAGNRDRGLELAAQLTSSLQLEDQAYGKLLEGQARLLDGDVQRAIRSFREANALADTWLGRFFLGRAYLEADALPEAYPEFEKCLERRGEATSLFLDEFPTYRYFPPVYYYMGKVQEGLRSPAASVSFRAFVDIRGTGEADPRIEEARSKL